jgi:hypothetical protein
MSALPRLVQNQSTREYSACTPGTRGLYFEHTEKLTVLGRHTRKPRGGGCSQRVGAVLAHQLASRRLGVPPRTEDSERKIGDSPGCLGGCGRGQIAVFHRSHETQLHFHDPGHRPSSASGRNGCARRLVETRSYTLPRQVVRSPLLLVNLPISKSTRSPRPCL